MQKTAVYIRDKQRPAKLHFVGYIQPFQERLEVQLREESSAAVSPWIPCPAQGSVLRRARRPGTH